MFKKQQYAITELFLFALIAISFCGCSHSDNTITLRFVDEEGKPVAGVETRRISDDIVLKSNRKGICTLRFKSEFIQIYTWHPDYVSLYYLFGPWGIDPIPEEYTFYLERGCEVGGVIVDEQGNPVKNATVRVYYEDSKPDSYLRLHFDQLKQEPTTDDKGRWTATQIPTKTFHPLGLCVFASGFAPQNVDVEQKDESFQALLDKSHRTVLAPGVNLVGKLVAEGNPNLERTILQVWGPFHSMTKIDVSPTGDFFLDDLAPGEYTFQIIPENHAPTLFSETISMDSAPIEIPLTPGKPIRFHVTDPEGKPISGAEIRIVILPTPENFSPAAFLADMAHVIKPTDAEGRTAWENALDEPCDYICYHKDYLHTPSPGLIPQEEEYPITMYRKLTVHGTVVDAETKQAVPWFFGSVRGWVEPEEREKWIDPEEEGQDQSGWLKPVGGMYPPVIRDTLYTIEPFGFTEARCRVEINAEGYEKAFSEEFFLKDGDRQFNFELKKAAKTEPQ